MNAARLLPVLLLLAVPASCRRDEPPRPAVDGFEDDEVRINFRGGKITRKERPLRTGNKEERLRERAEKIILSVEKSSPAQLLILAGGTMTLDICQEGYAKRRRVDAKSLTATLWLLGKSHEFELQVVGSSMDGTGKAYRFQAKRGVILSGEEMMLVVDVPNLAGDGLERATFVVPKGHEPY